MSLSQRSHRGSRSTWPLAGAASFSLAATVVAACQGAGAYGHAPLYVMLGQEREAAAAAREYTQVTARHDDVRRTPVVLFGVVESRAAGPGGQALVRLSVRTLEPESACARAGDDDSCRVTVRTADFGTIWALIPLRGGDDVGPGAVTQRSLVRVVGTIGQDVSAADGSPVLHASWYRHWPVAEYVSRASR